MLQATAVPVVLSIRFNAIVVTPYQPHPFTAIFE